MTQPITTSSLPSAIAKLSRRTEHAENLVLLGRQLWWSISKVSIDIHKFGAMWAAAGLDPKFAPTKIHGRSCVLRTLKALELDGFVREIACDKDKSVFVLVDEKIDRVAETARYDIDQNLVYDKKAKTLKAGRADFQPIVDNWMSEFGSKLISQDVRSAILEAVKSSGALTLSDKGGFYFVPAANMAIVDQLEQLIEELGGGSTLGTFDILDVKGEEPKNGAQLIKNFRKELIKDLELKLADLQEIEATPTGSSTVKRKNGLQDRVEALNKEIEKIGMYEDLLQHGAEDLRDRAKAVQAKAREMMRAL